MKERQKILVGITHGDFNGIGYEVILKTITDSHITDLCTPVIYGSSKLAGQYRKLLGINHLPLNIIDNAAAAREGEVNIINVMPDDLRIEPGVESRQAGEAAFAALEHAVTDLRSGDIQALVTAPINKHNIQSDTFTFPGHTEYLEASLGDGSQHSLMILFNDIVKVALVTTHLPVAKISPAITKDVIKEKIKIFNSSLKEDFGIHAPRIAVLALNPHGGDHGLIGNEEAEVIAPAIEECYNEKILCFGPYSADGFFGSGAFSKFDGVLAMYHDQGLAPFKTLAAQSGVNFTAGLDYVRTSPDHGTGYDIAGKGEADCASMRQAIYEAVDIYRRRLNHKSATRNPLRKQYYEKNKSDNVVLDLTKDNDA